VYWDAKQNFEFVKTAGTPNDQFDHVGLQSRKGHVCLVSCNLVVQFCFVRWYSSGIQTSLYTNICEIRTYEIQSMCYLSLKIKMKAFRYAQPEYACDDGCQVGPAR